jgi:signal transduction histidine kinase
VLRPRGDSATLARVADLQPSGRIGASLLSSALQETVLDAAPVALALVVGPEFHIAYANRAAEALGPGGRLVGRTIADAFPDAYGAAGPLLRRVWSRAEATAAEDLRCAGPAGGPGGRCFTWTCTPVVGTRRRIDAVVVAITETTARVRAESRHALFARMLSELSAGADVGTVLRIALARGVELLGADDGALFLLEDGGRLRGALETTPAGRTGLALDLADWPGVARAMASRRPRFLLPRRASPADPPWQRLASDGALAAPLVVDERCLGVLVVARGGAAWRRSEDLGFAGSVAAQCALAIDRARAYEAERHARERLTRLNAFTAALAASATTDEVVAATLADGAAALGACCAALALAGPDGALDLARIRGAVPSPPSRAALLDAFGARAPVFVAALPDDPPDRAPRACAALPLTVDDRCLGVLSLGFVDPPPFARGDRDGMVAVAHKCAQALERARLDETLRRERLQLQQILDEQREVERQLRAATAALEDAGRHKDQFLAMLAHELRNPLAAIRNATHVLRLHLAEGKPVDRAIEILERQIGNSSRILDDLLDVSRITRGLVQLRREPVQLDGIVTSAIESQRTLLEKLRHRLEVTLPPAPLTVDGDPTRLEQIVANLVNNAAKYTPEGGRIAVRLSRSAGLAVLRVSDDGNGIAPELLPRVFDLFVQGDLTLAHTNGGLGLGLTLVKRLVAMHGGTVTARSEGRGRGSVFEVRLPLAAGERPSVADAAAFAPAPVARRRILVVEGNPDAAEALVDAVAAMGHEVHWARDGSAAMAMSERLAPDVVLLDIGLPGLDGHEIARRLRTASRSSALVALTGHDREEDRARARAAGFDRHLTKPVEPDVLARVLAEIQNG